MKTKRSSLCRIDSKFGIISSIVLSIVILSITPAFAEHHTSFQKTLNVEKSNLQDTLMDVRNYEKVFPDFIRSVDILESTEQKALAEISMGFGAIPLQVQVEHNVVNENIHELKVVSGDLKGTQITTTLKKTWGFDGTPEKTTVVDIDMSLQVSGFLALLGVINENLVLYTLDSSLYSLQEYANGNLKNVEQEKPAPKKRR